MKNFYSPNFNKNKRLINSIKLIIIHYTGMQSGVDALNRLTDLKSKVSCHYLINENVCCARHVLHRILHSHVLSVHPGLRSFSMGDPNT